MEGSGDRVGTLPLLPLTPSPARLQKSLQNMDLAAKSHKSSHSLEQNQLGIAFPEAFPHPWNEPSLSPPAANPAAPLIQVFPSLLSSPIPWDLTSGSHPNPSICTNSPQISPPSLHPSAGNLVLWDLGCAPGSSSWGVGVLFPKKAIIINVPRYFIWVGRKRKREGWD